MWNKSFVNTFISVCSGTAVFPEIVKYSFFRMLWHLILIAVIGGCVNIAFRYHPFNSVYEKSCEKLQRKFGDIKYSAEGITPAIHPEKRGTVMFEDFRVDYFPKMEDLKTFKPAEDPYFGIAWTPESAVGWVFYKKRPSPFMPLLIPSVSDSDQMDKGMSFLFKRMQGESDSILSLYDISDIYKVHPKSDQFKQVPFREFETNILGVPQRIPTLFMFFLFGEIIMNCLIISPVYIFIFTLFSFFLGKSEMLSLKFRELFVVGIYTGFPGIVIATLYTALNLPYFDFQSVFLLSYLIYSFPVFTRLRMEKLNEK
jgi:hypothetical protein